MKNGIKRVLSIVIACVLLCGTLPNVARAVSAQDFTADEAIDWVKNNAKAKDVDGSSGVQCVDLILQYYDHLTGGHYGWLDGKLVLIRGDAEDYRYNAMCSGFERIENGTPRKGDILIWTGGRVYSNYNNGEGVGHVAIYESDYSVYELSGGATSVKHDTGLWNRQRRASDGNLLYYWGLIRPNFKGSSGASSTVSVPSVSDGQTIAPGKYILTNVGAGLNMNYNWSSSAQYQPIILSKADGTPEQTYDIQYAGSGKYSIRITHPNGGCVNVLRNTGERAQAGDKVTRYSPYSGSDLQLFYITSVGGGAYILQSASDTSKVVGSSDGNVHTAVKILDYSAGNNYAKWTLTPVEVTPATCTVSFNANGGSGTLASVTVEAGSYYQLPSEPPFIREGYRMEGWHDSPNGFDIYSGTVRIDRDMTFYARWIQNVYHKVTFNANGGVGGPDVLSVLATSDSTGVIPPEVPTRSGYTFQGWANSSDAVSATRMPGDTIVVMADYTLYAVWKAEIKTVTIDFDANGGFGAPTALTVELGKVCVLPNTIPTRNGYTFQGWATRSSAAAADYQAGGQLVPGANTTLYAVWKENTVPNPGGVTSEAEPNNSFAAANVIQVNTAVSGSLMTKSDADYFLFKLSKPGYVTLSFAHEDVNYTGGCWYVYLFNENNSVMTSMEIRGNKTETVSCPIGLDAGAYYVRVTAGSYYADPYYLTVGFSASSDWEREFNNSYKQANLIQVNTQVCGSLMTKDDADYFLFKLSEPGYVTLSFAHEDVNYTGGCWYVYLFNENNSVMTSMEIRGDRTETVSCPIGLDAGAYYVRVTAGSYYADPYYLTVGFSASSDWEREFNNSYKQANLIQVNTQVCGSLMTKDDADYFLFKLSEPGIVTISFAHEDVNYTDSCWYVYLFNEKNSVVTSLGVSGSRTETASSPIGLGAGSYYVRVTAGSYYANPYALTVKTSSGASAVTGISLNKSNIVLKVGETDSLSAAITPASAASSSVAWTSSNPAVAAVSSTGTVTAVGAGSAVITATAGGKTANCTVTVMDNSPASQGVHFERVTIYFQGQFSDVPANQWYTSGVADAFELGLVKGSTETTFNPFGYVTIAEAVVMAARIHCIYTNGAENFVQAGGMWYQVYMDYAYQNGLIDRAYYNCDVSQIATRAQVADILASSLPNDALPVISRVADNSIPDVKMTDRYAGNIYKLYRAGILTGSDANGTFNPLTYFTRAEAATFLARLAESDNRVPITLG